MSGRRQARRAATAAYLALIWVACDGEPEDGRERAPLQTVRDAAPIVRADSGCPQVGAWKECAVRERLERAGLSPQRHDTVRPEYLSVPGVTYRVGGSVLHVFLYPDSLARRHDMATLDSARAAPSAAADDWSARPTLIASNNLLAILVSDSERQIERVTNALTAGLPAR